MEVRINNHGPNSLSTKVCFSDESGFAVASVIQVTWCMLSIFLGWLAKLTIIKLGGLQLFLKARPFFLGLILGHFTGAGLSAFIDYFFFLGQGHTVYF